MTDYNTQALANYEREQDAQEASSDKIERITPFVEKELKIDVLNAFFKNDLFADVTFACHVKGKPIEGTQTLMDAIVATIDTDEVVEAFEALLLTPEAEKFKQAVAKNHAAMYTDALIEARGY